MKTKLFTDKVGLCHTYGCLVMHHAQLRVLVLLIVFLQPFSIYAVEFYEKPEIQSRMEKREVISVVKVVPHESDSKSEVLKMDAAGMVEGVTIPRAMKLMADYENLQRIAPDYIKLSELIVRKIGKNQYKKYLHMKTEVKTLLGTYRIEIYASVREEEHADDGKVLWEIVPAKELGRKITTPEHYVGLKGHVGVKKYLRQTASAPEKNVGGRGIHLSRAKKDQIMVLFKGALVRNDMSRIVPNFILQFAMEVALQRVGVLLRNYLETANGEPKAVDLESLSGKNTSQPASLSQ